MNEIEFRNWLINKGAKTKVAGDTISRLKRIEREIENCDIAVLVRILESHEFIRWRMSTTYNPQMIQGKQHHRGGIGKRTSTNYNLFSPTYSISNEYYPRDVIKVNWKESIRGLHPTQKPVSLCEYFIKTYSNKGDIIPDPFIGSGTTAVAAINTERKYIGFEKEKEYFEIAKNRLEKLTNI